ncbi:hypothetical protein COCSADRAFT_112453 [Bipolaris sorokiniana ND90Pr]|uniref:Uncharacterized protein n=1 Tax=Cochliobolus sativus (strain ND90Pr / ATCC 201652) TaxID=665912 RepID=M2RHM0_COCSN|nr:uncharacterized protein COCSADRAFT_112453 [Bipolaris sorokiniana ND90Pr]EMD66239.1 hypothetical protein COCSADRAFT_112453 [Bipolaris sorokiniana ND90Pr]
MSTGGHEEDDDVNHVPQPPSSSEVSTNTQRVEGYPGQTHSQSDEQTAAELEARRLQEEGDIIDYSDGEDEESAAVEEVEEAPHTEPSPSPATVQGDETSNAERQSPAAGSPSIGKQSNGDEDQGSFDTTNDPNVNAEQDFDNDPNEYWEYDEALEALEEVDPDESQSDEVQNDTTNFEFDGDANQDYGDYEYQDLEQQAEVEFTNGEDVDGENTATDGDYSMSANDVLNVHNAQWTVAQGLAQDVVETTTGDEDDNVEAQDEEDGVAGQLGSATSSAADPTTASSTDAHDVSSQGHKRSIDEAGHGVDIASDSIDAKRARV